MKIVRTSNFDREGPEGDQYFVAENTPGEYLAKKMCEAINDNPHSPHFYKVVPDDYKLPPKWEP